MIQNVFPHDFVFDFHRVGLWFGIWTLDRFLLEKILVGSYFPRHVHQGKAMVRGGCVTVIKLYMQLYLTWTCSMFEADVIRCDLWKIWNLKKFRTNFRTRLVILPWIHFAFRSSNLFDRLGFSMSSSTSPGSWRARGGFFHWYHWCMTVTITHWYHWCYEYLNEPKELWEILNVPKCIHNSLTGLQRHIDILYVSLS